MTHTWPELVSHSDPDALRELLVDRLKRPNEVGPRLDDRAGESPEEVFERLALRDDAFRARLDEAIAGYVNSGESNPDVVEARPVLRGLFELVQRLSLSASFSHLRAWFRRYQGSIAREPAAVLGRAALSALAASQPPGLADMGHFWIELFRNGPPAWLPRAFIGLRLHDANAAVVEVPALIRRARELGRNAGPLLAGLWRQPGAKTLLAEAIRRHAGQSDWEDARKNLTDALTSEERRDVPRNPRRRLLPLCAFDSFMVEL